MSKRNLYDHDLAMIAETHVPSSWQRSRKYVAGKCQTDPIPCQSVETQTTVSALRNTAGNRCDKEVEAKGRSTLIPTYKLSGMQYEYAGGHYDAKEVADFIESVMGEMTDIININNKSQAFERYHPNWTEDIDKVAVQLTLTPSFTMDDEYHVTAISWNATGTTIAVGYGRIDTVGWCKKKGYVCVWNLQRREMNPTNPDLTLECNSYVTAVAFHPVISAQLAAGTYNGEIVIWDLTEFNTTGGGSGASSGQQGQNEDIRNDIGSGSSKKTTMSMSSLSSSDSPKEPIAKLIWVQNAQERRPNLRYILCSGAQDGKVLFWNPAKKLQECEANYDLQNKKHHVVGVQGMAFVSSGGLGNNSAPNVDSTIILGVESGEIFRTKADIQKTNTNTKRLLDVDNFEHHSGPVNAVDCSPFFRNLFLSCSSDGSVRLYSLLERHPLVSLEPSSDTKHFMYGAQFSPFRPSVFAAVSRSSYMHIYDMERDKNKPVISVEAGVGGSAVTTCAFNRSNPKVIVTGDMKGSVRIWQLSSELFHATELERAIRKVEGSSNKAKEGKDDKKGGNEDDEGQKNHPIRQLFGFVF